MENRENFLPVFAAKKWRHHASVYAATSAQMPSWMRHTPKPKKKKAKGQRETDLRDFPEEIIPAHTVSTETLDNFYGKGCWRQLPSETYRRLRHEPESWTVEVHTVEVFVIRRFDGYTPLLCAYAEKRR